MAKQANPTVVGGFIVGAIALTVAGIITFGSGSWFREEYKYVAYFEDSVRGLSVGAPIRYRGVQVGNVSRIQAVWQQEGEQLLIPVELNFVRGTNEVVPDELQQAYPDPGEFMELLIRERGLKATLRQDSFVTGKLFVAVEFLPDEPIRLIGADGRPEIPTSRTGLLAKIEKSIGELPIEELAENLLQSVVSLNARLDDPKIDRVLTNLDQLIVDLDAQVVPLSDSARGTMDDARALMRRIDGQVDPVASSTRATMDDARALIRGIDEEVEPVASSARDAIGEAEDLLASVNGALGEEYAMLYRFTVLLEDMAQAARAIRSLADLLERHPEALLAGKNER
jgi:paraquat-inducible protein B